MSADEECEGIEHVDDERHLVFSHSPLQFRLHRDKMAYAQYCTVRNVPDSKISELVTVHGLAERTAIFLSEDKRQNKDAGVTKLCPFSVDLWRKMAYSIGQ